MTEFIRAALIGHPVRHSKSPLIHNAWIEKYGLAGAYEAIDLPPAELKRGLMGLAGRGYAGFNVTIPHKEAALALCDEADGLARAVGAVNTITVSDGKLFGTNTDVFGFLENTRQARPGHDFTSAPALVLGAGGAARAIVHGLLQEGAPEIYLCNRTWENACALAAGCADPPRIKVLSWDRRENPLARIGILVNASPLGMTGQPPLEIDLGTLSPAAVVNDIVYAPPETPLLRAARARGNPAIPGIGMLLHQARPAFQAWFGVLPEIDDVLLRQVSL